MKFANIKRGYVVVALLPLLTCLVSKSLSATSLELPYATDPDAIMARASERGAEFIVAELYDHPAVWDQVLAKIQTGDERWLRVAVQLQPGTDAGSASMLREAVSLALLHAPERVLRLAVPIFQLEYICGGRADPLPTYSTASDELERQINSVASVKDTDLLERRRRCLGKLEESRKHLKRFFEVK